MPVEQLGAAEAGHEDHDKEHKSKGEKKNKDLSHVPCKFFKVGQCTAGSSCPFSHNVSEPGQAKDVCSWYVKGNCKFGHKCALAHVLPGQPMSMDRRNKKAAQVQATAQGKGGDRDKERKKGSGGGSGSSGGTTTAKDSIFAALGAKAKSPLSISKAAISPSVPAPPLRDTDFAIGLDMPAVTREASIPSGGQTFAQVAARSDSSDAADFITRSFGDPNNMDRKPTGPVSSTSPSAPPGLAAPSAPRRSSDLGFGPIGSPPRNSPSGRTGLPPTPTAPAPPLQRINGFEPSPSPATPSNASNTGISQIPSPGFTPSNSKPNPQSFMAQSLDRDASAGLGGMGMGASGFSSGLGMGMGMGMGVPMSLGGGRAWDIRKGGLDVPFDDDMEELIPSSLDELLTDAERKRRWSRTGAQGPRPNAEAWHHKYSRSVPATSLMDNVKNIWGDTGVGPTALNRENGLGSGLNVVQTPSPSTSLLGSSNISAGFLNHRAYSDSPSHLTHPQTNALPPNSFSQAGGIPQHPPLTSSSSYLGLHPPPEHDNGPGYNGPASQLGMGSPLGGGMGIGLGPGNPMSPSARALQEHAPGQSLPQGLAAGLSRIHIKPASGLNSFGESPEFARSPPSFGSRAGNGSPSALGVGAPSAIGMNAASTTPRRRDWGLSSPLSGPVITNEIPIHPDEEILFEMEG